MALSVKSLAITEVDRAEVMRYMGYRGQEITPELDARIDDVVTHCLEVSKPKACLRAFDVSERVLCEDGIPELRLVGSALSLQGKSIAEHLDGAVAVGVMAVTLGAGVERELRRLSLTNPLEQVIFDAAATATVERAVDAAEALLVEEAAERGLYTNERFSPGYGDLPLSCQPTLLASLDALRRLGISLTPSLLMVPTKSVTAVLGFFNEPQVKGHLGCSSCNLSDFCVLRASGNTCRG